MEENDARKSDKRENSSTAMFAKKYSSRKKLTGKKNDSGGKNETKDSNSQKKEPFKYKCHRCRRPSHKTSDCTEKIKNSEDVKTAEKLCLCQVPTNSRNVKKQLLSPRNHKVNDYDA